MRPMTGYCGLHHVAGCLRERHIVEFLAHPRVLDAMTLALSQERPIHPEVFAKRVLLELTRVAERLDGLDNLEPVTPDDLAGLDAWATDALSR